MFESIEPSIMPEAMSQKGRAVRRIGASTGDLVLRFALALELAVETVGQTAVRIDAAYRVAEDVDVRVSTSRRLEVCVGGFPRKQTGRASSNGRARAGSSAPRNTPRPSAVRERTRILVHFDGLEEATADVLDCDLDLDGTVTKAVIGDPAGDA